MKTSSTARRTSTSQNAAIRAHLLAGHSITPLEAIGVFGAYRLAARVKELRNSGMPIVTRIHRDAYGKPYAEYLLLKPGMEFQHKFYRNDIYTRTVLSISGSEIVYERKRKGCAKGVRCSADISGVVLPTKATH